MIPGVVSHQVNPTRHSKLITRIAVITAAIRVN